MTTQTTTRTTSPSIQTSALVPRFGTRESTTLTVRARTTCSGAHVHVGSIKLRHEDVSEFAGRYQERPAVAVLAKLTSSAVNDIKGTLAPRMGLRVYAASATALTDDGPGSGLSGINLNLEIESPETEAAIEDLVQAWQQEFAPAALPEGAMIHVSFRVLDWYSA
jgi:hypothetical protein